MNIQWFPGHMTKALRMMEENVVIVDAIGYVLDARAPRSCFNPSFDKIVGNKPCVFILNKSDLADKVKLNKWEQYFKTRNIPYVTATATASAEASKISDAFAAITEPLRAKYKAKGLFKPVRCLIIGVPNCGKSTLINCLSGRKTVITGDKPGVTKGKQWVRLQSGLELLDTPGTLWPKFDSDRVASRLCFIGSIKDDVVDLYEVACMLIAELLDLYPDMLSARYKISVENKSVAEIFDAIALKRGFLLRGGEIDGERC
ncbi:MAG: ribosome biogenesis GTPase YlqF, partial [Firmicutes bacterium]|nr:ribosome biogenesis GTPase YlqF [Bacillota bacterium]